MAPKLIDYAKIHRNVNKMENSAIEAYTKKNLDYDDIENTLAFTLINIRKIAKPGQMKRAQRKPTPRNNAVDYAMIHWFANHIENLATEVYEKKNSHLAAILEALNEANQGLKALSTAANGGPDCPYALCENGLCRAMCPPAV